jgi:hypothetical protein
MAPPNTTYPQSRKPTTSIPANPLPKLSKPKITQQPHHFQLVRHVVNGATQHNLPSIKQTQNLNSSQSSTQIVKTQNYPTTPPFPTGKTCCKRFHPTQPTLNQGNPQPQFQPILYPNCQNPKLPKTQQPHHFQLVRHVVNGSTQHNPPSIKQAHNLNSSQSSTQIVKTQNYPTTPPFPTGKTCCKRFHPTQPTQHSKAMELDMVKLWEASLGGRLLRTFTWCCCCSNQIR